MLSSGRKRPATSNSVQRQQPKSARPATRQSSNERSPKKKVVSLLENENTISLSKQFEASTDISEFSNDDINILIAYYREYSQKACINEQYAEAKKAKGLEDLAKEELSQRTFIIPEYSEIAENAKESRANFETIWDAKFATFDKQTHEKEEELIKKQQHEMRKFERIWTHEMPNKYRKPSLRLLQLKSMEKSLAASCEIDRAAELHEQVENQMRKDVAQQQANLNRDFLLAKEKLIDKHQQELDHFIQTRTHYRQLMAADYIQERQAYVNRNIVVQTKQREAVYRGKRSDSPPTRTAAIPKDRNREVTTLLPPLCPPTQQRPKSRTSRSEKRSWTRKDQVQSEPPQEPLLLASDPERSTSENPTIPSTYSTSHKSAEEAITPTETPQSIKDGSIKSLESKQNSSSSSYYSSSSSSDEEVTKKTENKDKANREIPPKPAPEKESQANKKPDPKEKPKPKTNEKKEYSSSDYSYSEYSDDEKPKATK